VLLSGSHTQTHTPANTFLWILKKSVGRGFVEGIVSTLFKRVRKGAPLAKKSTGPSALPEESVGKKRLSLSNGKKQSLMREINNRLMKPREEGVWRGRSRGEEQTD